VQELAHSAPAQCNLYCCSRTHRALRWYSNAKWSDCVCSVGQTAFWNAAFKHTKWTFPEDGGGGRTGTCCSV